MRWTLRPQYPPGSSGPEWLRVEVPLFYVNERRQPRAVVVTLEDFRTHRQGAYYPAGTVWSEIPVERLEGHPLVAPPVGQPCPPGGSGGLGPPAGPPQTPLPGLI